MAEYRIVDVFAESKYAGNPLAVVLEAGSLAPDSMQAIAREFGFSETTFAIARGESGCVVRIFTPTAEIPFAGHPTLGTAAVLRAEYGLGDEVVLELGVGPVRVAFAPDAGGEIAWLEAPVPQLGKEHGRAATARALGLDESDLAPALPVQEVSAGIGFLVVPLASLTALRRVRLDSPALERLLGATPSIGVYLFCRETHEPGRDLAARMLFEATGVREDPATGSASACLGAYALEHGVFGPGALALQAEQGYEIDRPSLIRVRAELEAGVPRIRVGGRVLPVSRGRLE